MKAALFDLDGVIVDSESSYTVFWESMEGLYPTGIPDYAHAIKGTNLTKILAHYSSAAVRDDIVNRLHRFESIMDFPLYPGALELLAAMEARGISRALVTSSDDTKMSYLEAKLPELCSHFNAVITGSMVRRSKPHPEGYLRGAAALGADPADCWVFEDSLQGLRAGRDSGARVVAIATTNTREAVAPLADIVFDSIADVNLDLLP